MIVKGQTPTLGHLRHIMVLLH